MRFQKYDHLTEEEMAIRQDVFMKEQGFLKEFDEKDENATHLVLFDGEKAAATCRYFWKEDEKCFYIGRIAARMEYRGQGLGRMLLEEAQKDIKKTGGGLVRISGQVRVGGFYERMGYTRVGEEYFDEGRPHVLFEKVVSND